MLILLLERPWPAQFDLLRPGFQAHGTSFHGFLMLVQQCHKSTLCQLPSPHENEGSSVCL